MNQLEIKVTRLEQSLKALDARNVALTTRVIQLESMVDVLQTDLAARPVGTVSKKS